MGRTWGTTCLTEKEIDTASTLSLLPGIYKASLPHSSGFPKILRRVYYLLIAQTKTEVFTLIHTSKIRTLMRYLD
jgi:hypothetical protein